MAERGADVGGDAGKAEGSGHAQEALLSPHWRHVAAMRPRLRPQAAIHRHVLRGKVWYILQDNVNGRYHRITPELYRIVAGMDGRRTVQEIWIDAVAHDGEASPTQDEVIALLGRLHSADLMRGQLSPDLDEIARRSRNLVRRNLLSRVRSPLAIRVPLFDPDRFLEATAFLVRPFFTPIAAIIWFAFVCWGISLGAVHWTELSSDVADRVLSADNLLLLWVLFPLVKIVHELGHGYAAKCWGGEIHEIGIMFLVFVPVPYVEASSATAFPSRWQRVAVSAGGILAELPLAVVALWLWTEMEPGLARSAMYNVVLIAGVSTVLFNGNPLLRFDGYYILMDLLEMPNLGPRSNRYVGYLVQRYGFKMERVQSPADSPAERKILFGYAIASYFYRLFVMTAIILFVATKFFTIGVLLAIWAAFQMFVLPISKLVWFVVAAPALKGRRTRAIGLSGALVAVLACFLLFVPAPLATMAQGVVVAPEDSAVRAGANGFVLSVEAVPGQTVEPGQVLMSLEAPLIEAEIAVLKVQAEELRALLRATFDDPVNTRSFRAQLAHVEARLARAEERSGSLTVRAERGGVFLAHDTGALVGRYIGRGQSPGYVSALGDPVIEAALPAVDFDLLRSRLRGVEARPAWDLTKLGAAEVLLIEPSTTRQLRSAALAVPGGGAFSISPGAREDLTVLEDIFHVRLAVPDSWHLSRIGDRIYLRFDLGSEPVGFQLFRELRRMFLKRFDV
ncbi:peptidase M50 [Sedimentitalea sp. JM2-8]|uniref:Peptidase M50 n=1 Tax=Sedimentitalea xiamensis TaxID=3050037 RepID=A0ABT7FKG8_9RHOB|nr:site-2 protease family protein [Sedimentitalea xiamensis]MDK3075582.1 peptidase M50 [Sedimentitalea xiamensis]